MKQIQRMVGLALAVMCLGCEACGGASPPGATPHKVSYSVGTGGSHTPDASSTTTATTLPDDAPCRGAQVQGALKGIQGATGNWVAAFWIVDVSPTPCELQSPLHVAMVNGAGVVQQSAVWTFRPVPLSAFAAMPGGVVEPLGSIGWVNLEWATEANAAAAMGATTTMCPIPDFTPSSIQMAFGDEGTDLHFTDLTADARTIAICGTGFGAMAGGAFGPG